MRKSQKMFINRIVAESIDILFNEAEENFQKHPERSKRYLKMIWALSKKYNFRLNKKQKLKFCKKCFTLWIPEKTVNITFDNRHNMFEFVCILCGHKKRFK